MAANGTSYGPGHARVPGSGRAKGTPNRDRATTIKRIMEEADPIGLLCAVMRGEPLEAAPAPGEPAALLYPTIADRLGAARVLAAKVMPDLRSVELAGAGNLVLVNLQLGQAVTVLAEGQGAPRLEDRAA